MNIEITFVIDRINTVVGSCRNGDQLNVAKKYSIMLIDRWYDDTYSKGSLCMRLKGHHDRQMMINFLNVVIHRTGLL